MSIIAILDGLRVRNESNERSHHMVRAKRAKTARALARMRLAGPVLEQRRAGALALPLVVTLTRIGPRMMDDDGAIASLKACRDGVADALGIDDRDPRVQWRYGQERGKPRQYGVRITVEATS